MTDALRDRHPERPDERDALEQREQRDRRDERDLRDEHDQPDASDVVEGPVGDARLREPSEVEAEDAGADLEQLPDVRSTGANAQVRIPRS